jgi:programmed cell death protein 5
MEDISAVRQRKIERFKAQTQQQEHQIQQQLAQFEAVVKQHLTPNALQRYGNIRAAHPELATRLVLVLAQAIQAEHIQQVDDNTLKVVLHKLNEKKDITITRK